MFSTEGTGALFIYYRVAPNHARTCYDSVSAFQSELKRTDADWQVSLWARPSSAAEESATWMEVYQHRQGIDAHRQAWLQQQFEEKLDLSGMGARHVEVFSPLIDAPASTQSQGG